MPKRIGILHFAGPPTVGGVEATIAHHARGLSTLGYEVRVISGDGAAFDERFEHRIIPLFGSRDERVLAVKSELDKGFVSDAFHDLVSEQEQALQEALAGFDLCIVHNAHTLNKNLSLSAALAKLDMPLIAWAHDMAWTNPQYQGELYNAYPWNLLRQKWANSTYITVSQARQEELAELLGVEKETIVVVTAGVDIGAFLHWTESMCRIAESLQLLDADALLLLPARITRRKNIELGLRVLAELRQNSKKDYRLIVTGPPGPHNPTNRDYLSELLEFRQKLGLQNAAHFLYELDTPPFIPDDSTVANLYQIADALFFPSLDEGLGIPILEAGLAGLPIFCSDLAPFRQTGQAEPHYFKPREDSPEVIARMMLDTFERDAVQRLKSRVRREYRWEYIVRSQIVPLVEEL